MHRFFTAPENITDKKAILRGTDVAHIRTVLRLKSGDRVQVLDGCGNCYIDYAHVGPQGNALLANRFSELFSQELK